MSTFFSDLLNVKPAVLAKHGAFNISLITDLPLFIDPFLLFNSKKREYRQLHDDVIAYLIFLRDKAQAGAVADPLLRAWYCFPEVKQTWLGFSQVGNRGSGLGMDFARSLHSSLHQLFPAFGKERITKGSHLEKVCLIREGVGRDNISDFTTNLIKAFLCEFTQRFALAHLAEGQRRLVGVKNVTFNYDTEVWEPGAFTLPWLDGDYVLLTPRDILTRDENWINKGDLIRDFDALPTAIPNGQLRAQIENYLHKALLPYTRRGKTPTAKERAEAAVSTILSFPALIDYYILFKEQHGDQAMSLSAAKVFSSEQLFILQLRDLQRLLQRSGPFYDTPVTTYEEAHQRLAYLKDVIENKGGHRRFYVDGKPVGRESDLQTMYRLVWFGTPSDVSSEVNDGRGPADYKISRGAGDKTIVEMKLASNTQLERNLKRQAEIYQRASDAPHAIKVIIFFSGQQERRVKAILKRLKLTDSKDIVLIDARDDNKPSGSRA